MTNEVKFKQGKNSGLTEALVDGNKDTLYFATDQAVMGAAGKLYYGQPTIKYVDNKIQLLGVSGETAPVLGEVDLTLDSFLEKAKYFDKAVDLSGDTDSVLSWANEGITEETEKFTADAVISEYKKAFAVGEGELPAEHSAIVMVMHNEASTGDAHSLVVIPVGKLVGDAQTEIDQIEKSVGLEEDGTFDNEAEGVSKDAETIKDAIKAIDDNLGVKATGTTVSAETVWGAIEELASEKTVVVAAEANKNVTVTSADTNGQVTYTVGESGLTVEANGVAVKVENTVAANLSALDDQVKATTLTAGTVNGSGVTISSGDEGTSFSVVISGSDIAVGTDIVSGENATFISADKTIDKALQSIVDEILDNEAVESAAIAALADAAGTKDEDGNIAYQVHGTDSILSGATSLDSADVALAKAIEDLQSTAGALKGKDAIEVAKESETSDALQVSLKLDNTGVTGANGGIELTQSEDGLNAKLYWGSF